MDPRTAGGDPGALRRVGKCPFFDASAARWSAPSALPSPRPRAGWRSPVVKAVIQRVSRAEVRVDGQTIGAIGGGLVVLLGVFRSDTPPDAERLAHRTASLRIFSDESGKMNMSLLDVGGEALVISQFTLAGSTRRGHRPSFDAAAPLEAAEPLYEQYAGEVARLGVRVARGRFRAMMDVELVNDGPVTIVLEEPRGAEEPE